MASEVSSFGSLAFAGGGTKRPVARNVDTNKKENRKSWPRIECLPDVFDWDRCSMESGAAVKAGESNRALL
jgi:hypothetical protein